MDQLLTTDAAALRFLLTEELYAIEEQPVTFVKQEKAAVAEQAAPVQQEPRQARSFDYTGENRRYLLVAVADPAANYLNKTDLDSLLKILSSKKLELADIALLNTADMEPCTFDELRSFFACSKILTFGINPAILGIKGVSANTPGTYEGIPVLGTWHLEQLMSDKRKKTVFWNALKSF